MEGQEHELTLAAIDAMSPREIGGLLEQTRANLVKLEVMRTDLMNGDDLVMHALLVAKARRMIAFLEVVAVYQSDQEGTDEQH